MPARKSMRSAPNVPKGTKMQSQKHVPGKSKAIQAKAGHVDKGPEMGFTPIKHF